MTTLLIVSTLGPLIIIILTETLRERSFGKVRARIVWNWYKEFLVVYAMVLLFTEAAKVAFGEHRPHFLSTCVPDAAHTCDSGAYVEEFKCTNDGVTSYFLVDSSRSFPSGHASVSFVAGTYSAVRIEYKLFHIQPLIKNMLFSDCSALAYANASNWAVFETFSSVPLFTMECFVFFISNHGQKAPLVGCSGRNNFGCYRCLLCFVLLKKLDCKVSKNVSFDYHVARRTE